MDLDNNGKVDLREFQIWSLRNTVGSMVDGYLAERRATRRFAGQGRAGQGARTHTCVPPDSAFCASSGGVQPPCLAVLCFAPVTPAALSPCGRTMTFADHAARIDAEQTPTGGPPAQPGERHG